MSRGLVLDFFCGRGGWSKAAAAQGFTPVGYDIADVGYPFELIRTPLPLPTSEFARHKPVLAFFSPPCDDFARACLPWLRTVKNPSTELLIWSIKTARELDCPAIVECSRFAARYVPGAFFVGSYALWGDIPALLPEVPRRKMQVSGTTPAKRAEMPPALADWLVETLKPR